MAPTLKAFAANLLALTGFARKSVTEEPTETDVDWINYHSNTTYNLTELISPLEWGQLNFIHTTDTHGWLEGHLGDDRYKADFGEFKSFVERMKAIAAEKDVDLYIVDTGDLHDGTGFSDVTSPDGLYTDEIFKALPFDLLTIGNHELYKADVSRHTYNTFVPHWNGHYITTNVDIYDTNTGSLVPFGKRYYHFTTAHGVRVLVLGFLFDFTGNSNATVITKVEDTIQTEWYQHQIRRQDVDLFLVLGHIPIRDWNEWKAIHASIRAVHPNTPIQIFGGHSHVRDFTVFDNASVALESGRYCETVGWLAIDGISSSNATVQNIGKTVANITSRQSYSNVTGSNITLSYSRRYLDFNRETFMFHTNTNDSTFNTTAGYNLTKQITAYRNKLNISVPYGCSPQNYYMTEVPHNSSYSLYKFFNDEVYPSIVVNEERDSYPHVILTIGGGFRGNLYKGEFNTDTMYQVSPYSTNFFNYIPSVPYKYAKYVYTSLNNGPTLRADALEGFFMTPGYTTSDDLGEDGDDTRHIEVPYYKSPNVLYKEISFNGTEPDYVDLISINFIQKKVTNALNVIANKTLYKDSDWMSYFVRDDGRDSLTDLLPLYAQKYWNKTCSN
ncbi:phosphoprotein phosphatase [Schizosaccharomyces japonicus yFS275]|uniref:Phosphoprotein phosphatase n=1 Tax=Schizosaccharomyces japonicus (strain yFS275 / FY16936) TaxID=402676 RepID=B6K0M2_SCHJY|nr:phosphoprotein phosphatase [Schizosaccharomyces japonicus yFS275]EEB07493.1 phosphoprotein phosphatase [Schizosaccharomyces japonicus yFS275]